MGLKDKKFLTYRCLIIHIDHVESFEFFKALIKKL